MNSLPISQRPGLVIAKMPRRNSDPRPRCPRDVPRKLPGTAGGLQGFYRVLRKIPARRAHPENRPRLCVFFSLANFDVAMPDSATILPATPPITSDGGISVALSLKIPTGLAAGLIFFPPGNLSGAALLDRLLNSALAAKGLLIWGGLAGELNDCLGLWVARDHRHALHIIHEEIKTACLHVFAKTGWRDASEGIWRCAHPAGVQVDFDSLISIEENDRLAAKHQAFIDANVAFLQVVKQAAMTRNPKPETGNSKPENGNGS